MEREGTSERGGRGGDQGMILILENNIFIFNRDRFEEKFELPG